MFYNRRAVLAVIIWVLLVVGVFAVAHLFMNSEAQQNPFATPLPRLYQSNSDLPPTATVIPYSTPPWETSNSPEEVCINLVRRGFVDGMSYVNNGYVVMESEEYCYVEGFFLALDYYNGDN